MILPVRVFGIAEVTITRSGRASPPMVSPTRFRTSSGTPSASPDTVTNATGTVPLVASGTPTTAASTTRGWVPTTASISIVDRRCAATLMTSSARPSTQRCPSASTTASSLVA